MLWVYLLIVLAGGEVTYTYLGAFPTKADCEFDRSEWVSVMKESPLPPHISVRLDEKCELKIFETKGEQEL